MVIAFMYDGSKVSKSTALQFDQFFCSTRIRHNEIRHPGRTIVYEASGGLIAGGSVSLRN